MVSITINPKGKSRDGRLSQVDEYLLVVYLGKAEVSNFKGDGGEQEIRWRYLRRNDMASKRGTKKGGPNQFYPIYVDKETHKIVKIGLPLTPDQPLEGAPEVPGAITVFPINEDGIHMNWGLTGASLKKAMEQGYVRVTPGSHSQQPYTIAALTGPNIKKVEEGIYHVKETRPDGSKIVVIPRGKESRPTTAWRQTRYDAGTYGTSLIREILPDREFTFPKSLYAVEDTLRLFLGDKPSALVLDFFAGSGTTAHALMRLNQEDLGKRRCIIVTNNEVSEKGSEEATLQGFKPGDYSWERYGICQSITWPRCKFSILGKRDDGSQLNGEYISGKTLEKERPRKFQQISFTSIADLTTVAKKKQLVALINGIPQSEVKKDSAFVISEKHPASILFDESQADTWLDALENQEHVTDFYIVTASKPTFDDIKLRIHDLLGPMIVTEEQKRSMREGFPANLEYFRLEFLDKDHVALGRQFREILPILWLRAGAIGPRPELPKNKPIPAMLLPEHNPFAVLVDETRFADFLAQLQGRDGMTHAYLVTDSEEAFQEMAGHLNVPNVIQLYRDYLENFAINKGEGAQ